MKTPQALTSLRYEEFLPVFDGFSEGVIITDRHGTIVYYNTAMAAIDDLPPEEALGKTVLEVYDLDENTSVVMQCLQQRRPLIDRALVYRTRMGRFSNSIHTVFPLFKGHRLAGAICLVREYNVLEETIASISIPRAKAVRSTETLYTFDGIIGEDPEFLRSVNTARMAANTPSPVMLYGETGTGKELFAQAIHSHSDRAKRRYTPVNCAAIPENLLEGILFGTSKGAFTGARNKEGLFGRTNGGTLFLDELNAMAIGLQAKILRVIQERKVRRLGSLRETPIDLKIISSVNQEPHVAIAENCLRPDLFYRLGVVFIPLPPLRERPGDIEVLSLHFLAKHSHALGKRVVAIADEVLQIFHNYHWPGNVRELEHVIEGALNMITTSSTLKLLHLQSHLPTWHRLRGSKETLSASNGLAVAAPHLCPPPTTIQRTAPGGSAPVEGNLAASQAALERQTIEEALARHQGHVTRAAESVGISRQLLHYKMKKHGLQRSDFIPVAVDVSVPIRPKN
ncbi:MAG: sigma 54-interacting transcriptional regulator [Desulfosarcinaceae bacterium]|nr:sigma 54-interacting transcriptional regulator [Desulfosarcinaceae bacterium]